MVWVSIYASHGSKIQINSIWLSFQCFRLLIMIRNDLSFNLRQSHCNSPRASTRKLHGFKGKAQTVELFLPMYFFTSSANFPLLLFEIRQIEIWFFFEWNSADSISKGWICFCLQFYVLVLPDVYSHFDMYFWLLQAVFWLKFKKHTKTPLFS